ncbi:MAG: restriction endonuclease subunit S [Alphaproteobacteria bacterium]|jgi:type I restriction enzyme S subunit
MSGIDAWQRRLPPNWTVRPLRSVAEYAVSNVDKIPSDDELPVRLCNYTDVYNNETINLGMEFMAGTATQAEIDKFHLLADDVVITKDSESWDDIAIPALVIETADDLVCGYHLAMIRPDPEKLDGTFLFRCLQAKTLRIQLELAANGITRFGIPKNAIGSMALPVPPTPIQRVIARFLDRETVDIDALIAAKRRLLDLLAEKRRAIVAEAVMRGLNPAAPLRPSGIEWLGDIPAHWEACHLKRVLARLDYGTSESTDVSGSVAILRMGDIQDGEIDFSNLAYLDQVEDDLLLREGDLVFNRTNSLDQIGKVALFRGNVGFPVSFASYLVRLRSEDSVIPEYLNWVLNSSYALAWARAEALPSIGQANLNPSRYGYLPIALPSLAEQQKITKYLAESVARLDGIRAATERSITLLKERRSALIAAAVTGQIDIPEAA